MPLIGRDTEIGRLREHVAQRQHMLVVGPIGVGKSALLRAAVEERKDVLIVEQLTPFKAALLAIAQQLHAQGRLTLPKATAQYLAWDEVKSHLTALNAPELVQLLTPQLAGAVLVLDDGDGLTPATARLLEPWFDAALVLGAVTRLPGESPELQRFVWHFQLLRLAPLAADDARTLLWSQCDRAAIPEPQAFEQHVLQTAGGNPLALRELAAQAQRLPLTTVADIRALHHDAGVRYVDLTPGILVIGACAVAIRFMALGLNDIEAYILAGMFGAFFLVSRYFLYRALRRSS